MRSVVIIAIITLVSCSAGKTIQALTHAELTGAWQHTEGTEAQVILFIDHYFTHTAYDLQHRRFLYTRGGPYTIQNGQIQVTYEFDTRQKEQVGTSVSYAAIPLAGTLQTNINGQIRQFRKTDNGIAPLAGVWQITGRMQNGAIQQIHRTGTRKTIKILSGSRFQWAAIDPGTKEFMGTGGGTYSFTNGKYTEHIEFFSRDSSRVGASLTFDGRIENGQWHHSGMSSRGEPIYEIWSRERGN